MIDEAQLHGIDLERNCQLVHRRFDREHAGALAGRAHVSRTRKIERDDRIDRAHIVDGVDRLGRPHESLGVGADVVALAESFMDERDQLAVRIRA